MKKMIVWCILVVLVVLTVVTVGGSFYMLDYSLSPDANRADTAFCFRKQFRTYPETHPWVDSLRRIDALRDTFVTVPENNEKHHALYVRKGSNKTALILHGWRNCSIDFLFLARLYEKVLGYNVVLPDFHAHGLSEGDMIQMGWLDRKDMLHWLSIFQTDTVVVHGVSMGAATAMMMSAEALPKGIKDIRFIDDCGYTSVWDEFAGELKKQFGLPEFPMMYTTSLLCKLRYGWSFSEASAIEQVRKSDRPIFYIHGSIDSFVPTEMAHRLFNSKSSKKRLWIAEGAEHAESYMKNKVEYLNHIRNFLNEN